MHILPPTGIGDHLHLPMSRHSVFGNRRRRSTRSSSAPQPPPARIYFPQPTSARRRSMDLPINSSNPLGALHRPTPNIWVLELKNGVDNRLTGVVCTKVITPALDIVEKEWRVARNKALKADDKAGAGGAFIIVGNLDQNKFFRWVVSCA